MLTLTLTRTFTSYQCSTKQSTREVKFKWELDNFKSKLSVLWFLLYSFSLFHSMPSVSSLDSRRQRPEVFVFLPHYFDFHLLSLLLLLFFIYLNWEEFIRMRKEIILFSLLLSRYKDWLSSLGNSLNRRLRMRFSQLGKQVMSRLVRVTGFQIYQKKQQQHQQH